ncbi:OmpA family protein [Thermodesulfobacteriota bacterium]
MRNISTFLVVVLAVSMQFACVSKKQYGELETTLAEQQKQTEENDQKLEDTEKKLSEASGLRDQYAAELSFMENQLTDLQKTNFELTEQLEIAKAESQKMRSIIQLQDEVIRQTDETRKKIEIGLKDQIEKQEIKLEEMQGRLKVTFIDKILFNTGSVVINDRGKELLSKIADSLRDNLNQKILVEGHTDNVGIGKELRQRYPTNWELSAARATAVVRFLQEMTGLEPERLSACGYGYYRPLAPSDTEEGRRQNRRIEIILVPSN